jgi:hypothetical protein
VTGEFAGTIHSEQDYQLQSPIPAHQSHANYLTLEASFGVDVTATILVDQSGPSAQSDTVNLSIAEDGTPTNSR